WTHYRLLLRVDDPDARAFVRGRGDQRPLVDPRAGAADQLAALPAARPEPGPGGCARAGPQGPRDPCAPGLGEGPRRIGVHRAAPGRAVPRDRPGAGPDRPAAAVPPGAGQGVCLLGPPAA